LATFQTLQSSFTFGPVKDPKQQHTNSQTNELTGKQKPFCPINHRGKEGKLVRKTKLFVSYIFW